MLLFGSKLDSELLQDPGVPIHGKEAANNLFFADPSMYVPAAAQRRSDGAEHWGLQARGPSHHSSCDQCQGPGCAIHQVTFRALSVAAPFFWPAFAVEVIKG